MNETSITTPEQFEALPVGTVVVDDGGDIGLRTRKDWRWTDPIQDEIGPYGRVQVLYRPDAIAHTASRAGQAPTQGEVAAWLADNFGPGRSVEQQTLVLAEEVGELCRAVVKRAQGIRGTRVEWTERLHAEAADVLITLLAIAATEGFDLVTATARKWGEVTGRAAHAKRAPNQRAPEAPVCCDVCERVRDATELAATGEVRVCWDCADDAEAVAGGDASPSAAVESEVA